jgi:hypothetical protein
MFLAAVGTKLLRRDNGHDLKLGSGSRRHGMQPFHRLDETCCIG